MPDGAGITPHSINLSRPTFEDMFLTGRSLRDDSPRDSDVFVHDTSVLEGILVAVALAAACLWLGSRLPQAGRLRPAPRQAAGIGTRLRSGLPVLGR